MTREKKTVSMSSFIAARNEGLTFPQMAEKFNLSVAQVKQINSKLNLSKRAKPVGYELVDDTTPAGNNNSTNINQE